MKSAVLFILDVLGSAEVCEEFVTIGGMESQAQYVIDHDEIEEAKLHAARLRGKM